MAVVKKKLICRQYLARSLYAVSAQQIFVEAIQEGQCLEQSAGAVAPLPAPDMTPE